MIQYLVMMGIRVACIAVLPFLRGWWMVLPVLGAVFLPYFAVVSANVVRGSRGGAVLRPGGIRRVGEPDEDATPSAPADGDARRPDGSDG
ncbi:DUF3099 domain-containing protein [Agromyces seonyuensis]|nr:DUF3099 domain-containing protein [Agromyces seonyuensis]